MDLDDFTIDTDRDALERLGGWLNRLQFELSRYLGMIEEAENDDDIGIYEYMLWHNKENLCDLLDGSKENTNFSRSGFAFIYKYMNKDTLNAEVQALIEEVIDYVLHPTEARYAGEIGMKFIYSNSYDWKYYGPTFNKVYKRMHDAYLDKLFKKKGLAD